MAPPPEHDKEPKAPDKIAISAKHDESNTLQNQTADELVISEPMKPTSSHTNNSDTDDKHVETLDDRQLRALLDEAITYKCPKDREGKSTLFKELLEKVERQDDQATTAASRGWGVRSARVKQGGAKNRRSLPHSNSLQDIVDALAAERVHRTRSRHHTHHQSQQSQAQVSARTHHGGSLPSGVDTSFLLGEEPGRVCGAAEYVATVLCVNPAPLSERRVSASDAHSGTEAEPAARRNKTSTGQMTYTARATLEIGTSSSSSRATTTTTASNQVRTIPHTPPLTQLRSTTYQHEKKDTNQMRPGDTNQQRLMTALEPRRGGGGDTDCVKKNNNIQITTKVNADKSSKVAPKYKRDIDKAMHSNDGRNIEKQDYMTAIKDNENANIDNKERSYTGLSKPEKSNCRAKPPDNDVTQIRSKQVVSMLQNRSCGSNENINGKEEKKKLTILQREPNKKLIPTTQAIHTSPVQNVISKHLDDFKILNKDVKFPIKILLRDKTTTLKENVGKSTIPTNEFQFKISSTTKLDPKSSTSYTEQSIARRHKENSDKCNENSKKQNNTNQYMQEWKPSKTDLQIYENWYKINYQCDIEPPKQIWGQESIVHPHDHKNVNTQRKEPVVKNEVSQPKEALIKSDSSKLQQQYVLGTNNISKLKKIIEPPKQIWGPESIVYPHNHKNVNTQRREPVKNVTKTNQGKETMVKNVVTMPREALVKSNLSRPQQQCIPATNNIPKFKQFIEPPRQIWGPESIVYSHNHKNITTQRREPMVKNVTTTTRAKETTMPREALAKNNLSRLQHQYIPATNNIPQFQQFIEPPRQIWGPESIVYSHNHKNITNQRRKPILKKLVNQAKDTMVENSITLPKEAVAKSDTSKIQQNYGLATNNNPKFKQFIETPRQKWEPESVAYSHNHENIVALPKNVPDLNKNKNTPQQIAKLLKLTQLELDSKVSKNNQKAPLAEPKKASDFGKYQNKIQQNNFQQAAAATPGYISTGSPERLYSVKSSNLQCNSVYKNDPFLQHFYHDGVYQPPSFKFISKNQQPSEPATYADTHSQICNNIQIKSDDIINDHEVKIIKSNVSAMKTDNRHNVLPMSIGYPSTYSDTDYNTKTISKHGCSIDNLGRKNASVVKDNGTRIIDNCVERNNDNKTCYQLSAVITSVSFDTETLNGSVAKIKHLSTELKENKCNVDIMKINVDTETSVKRQIVCSDTKIENIEVNKSIGGDSQNQGEKVFENDLVGVLTDNEGLIKKACATNLINTTIGNITSTRCKIVNSANKIENIEVDKSTKINSQKLGGKLIENDFVDDLTDDKRLIKKECAINLTKSTIGIETSTECKIDGSSTKTENTEVNKSTGANRPKQVEEVIENDIFDVLTDSKELKKKERDTNLFRSTIGIETSTECKIDGSATKTENTEVNKSTEANRPKQVEEVIENDLFDVLTDSKGLLKKERDTHFFRSAIGIGTSTECEIDSSATKMKNNEVNISTGVNIEKQGKEVIENDLVDVLTDNKILMKKGCATNLIDSTVGINTSTECEVVVSATENITIKQSSLNLEEKTMENNSVVELAPDLAQIDVYETDTQSVKSKYDDKTHEGCAISSFKCESALTNKSYLKLQNNDLVTETLLDISQKCEVTGNEIVQSEHKADVNVKIVLDEMFESDIVNIFDDHKLPMKRSQDSHYNNVVALPHKQKDNEEELIELSNLKNSYNNIKNDNFFSSQIQFINMIKSETNESKLAVIQEDTMYHDNYESPSSKKDCLELVHMNKDIKMSTNNSDISLNKGKKTKDYASDICKVLGLTPLKEKEVQHDLPLLTNSTLLLFELPKLISLKSAISAIKDQPKVMQAPKDKKKKVKSKNGDKTIQVQSNTDRSLSKLIFENLFQDRSTEYKIIEISTSNNKVDSGIPFSCITTPEVVTSSSSSSAAAAVTQQSAVALDVKPLQLGSEYCAVTSLTGELFAATPARRLAPTGVTLAPPAEPRRITQPRNVIATTINGLPLSRPTYNSTGTATTDEFKKSTDENGNSVQGSNTTSSGSSQHKKPRRKKSSKNETVIKSDLIDGYQGNKDLNELLKFIESNADNGRSQKLGRVNAKHKDDSDERTKKRSSDRRRDKERVKRASSLEEVSRTTLEELTTPRRTRAPADSQRRSWGDDYRAHPPSTPATTPATPATTPSSDKKKQTAKPATPIEREPGDIAVEFTEFQTVTKRKKQRKRGVESAAPPPATRRTSPSPRRKSAPPSDRSGDSTDDMESVHSLPARPAPPTAPASYADIARTRHNIPDLIESCNYYTEDGATELIPSPPEEEYPALTPPRALPPPAPSPPDVVARPPVILLDEPKVPELDGVTFGFDINEQLLKGATTRRCDLVRESAVAVRAGLRYLPPPSPPTGHTTELIVDYVGQAWEDIIKSGGGKVRYFSE